MQHSPHFGSRQLPCVRLPPSGLRKTFRVFTHADRDSAPRAIVGTFLNLVIALWWKTETPWSLLFQLLGTDAAVISHIHRLAVTTNRISLWHYAFVPLTVISFVPVLIGCCLNRLRYIVSRLHSLPQRRTNTDTRRCSTASQREPS